MTTSPPGNEFPPREVRPDSSGSVHPSRSPPGASPTKAGVVVYAYPWSVAPKTGRGVERYAYELVSNLAPLEQGLRVVSLPEAGLARYLASFTSVPARTLTLRPRVFHAVSPYSARMLLALRRRPIITTVHDLVFRQWAPDSPTFFDRRRRVYNELAIRKSDVIIVPFQFTKHRIRDLYGVPEDRFRVVHYGMDLQPFYREADRLGSSDERGVDVLFLGGTNALSRGGRVVLQVYEQLLQSNPGVRLAISAPGWHGEVLRANARASGMEGRLRWIGFVPEPELASVLANSSVFLYPTPMGFSFLLMQAMAAGSAVVTSSAYDNPEFADGAAITLGPEEVDGYVHSILSLLSDSNARGQLVARARRRLLEFTPASMAAGTAEVYDEF